MREPTECAADVLDFEADDSGSVLPSSAHLSRSEFPQRNGAPLSGMSQDPRDLNVPQDRQGDSGAPLHAHPAAHTQLPMERFTRGYRIEVLKAYLTTRLVEDCSVSDEYRRRHSPRRATPQPPWPRVPQLPGQDPARRRSPIRPRSPDDRFPPEAPRHMTSDSAGSLRVCVLVALVGLSSLESCRSFLTPCDGVGHASVIVTVKDAQTGNRPPQGIVLVLDDGQVADTTFYPAGSGNPVQVPVGLDRFGTFTVTVNTTGYVPWTRSNVIVPWNGRCEQAETQSLEANIEPISQ